MPLIAYSAVQQGPPDGWFSITCAMTGLLLTAIGYGIINPIQSIFVGDQYGKGLVNRFHYLIQRQRMKRGV